MEIRNSICLYRAARNAQYYKTKNVSLTESDNDIPISPYFHQTLGIYSSILVSLVILEVSSARLTFYFCLTTAQNLHNKMFATLMKAPLSFFETNPVGKIFLTFVLTRS